MFGTLSHPWPLIMYNFQSPANYSLTADLILSCTQNPAPCPWCAFPQKNVQLPGGSLPPLHIFHVHHVNFPLLKFQKRGPMEYFIRSCPHYCEDLLAAHPTPKLKDHPFSAVHKVPHICTVFVLYIYSWIWEPLYDCLGPTPSSF
jgi:hypothetical protein